jgi:hypothetical protein
METRRVDEAVRGRMLFRLLFRTQDDHYEPETARVLIAALTGLDKDSGSVSIRLWAMNAVAETDNGRN